MRKPKIQREPTLNYIDCMDYLVYKKRITREERDHLWTELFEQGVSNGNDKYFYLHNHQFPTDGKDTLSAKISEILFSVFPSKNDRILFWMCW